jgi:hypothetical protein
MDGHMARKYKGWLADHATGPILAGSVVVGGLTGEGASKIHDAIINSQASDEIHAAMVQAAAADRDPPPRKEGEAPPAKREDVAGRVGKEAEAKKEEFRNVAVPAGIGLGAVAGPGIIATRRRRNQDGRKSYAESSEDQGTETGRDR